MENQTEEDKNEQTANRSSQPEIKSEVAIRITMMPRDTNSHGTVFGGIILS